MSENKLNSRRKVLLGLGGGVAGATQLPKTWSKPVIDTILLPAHAQTTATTGFGGTGDELNALNMPTRQNMLSNIISPAMADYGVFPEQLYVTEISDGAFEAYVLFEEMGYKKELIEEASYGGVYKAVGQINGPRAKLTFLEGCDILSHFKKPKPKPKIKITQVGETASFKLRLFGEVILKGDLNPSSDIPSSNCLEPD